MIKTVLVVDDSPDVIYAIKHVLENLDDEYKVIGADGGMQCLELLENNQIPDIILLDIMMPVMDGWDTIKEIVDRGYAAGNIIAILTAKDVPDQKMEGLKEYVIDYMTKPFDPKELVANVKEYFAYLK